MPDPRNNMLREPVAKAIVPNLVLNDGIAIGKTVSLDIDVHKLAKMFGIGTLVGASLTADGKVSLQGVKEGV